MASMVFSRALFLSGLANAGALSEARVFQGSPGVRVALGVEVSISCETTGAELALESGLALANCPANCQESQVAVAYGASVHPTTSSICAAALVDGALPQFGGKARALLLVLFRYFAAARLGCRQRSAQRSCVRRG